MQSRTKLYLTLLLPVQIIIIKILSFFPETIENYYSNGIYNFISKGLRYAFGWIPFSFGDIGYIILIILLIRFIVIKVFGKQITVKGFFLEVGSVLSIVYGLFHILWGLNYYRQPLHEILKLDDDYTTEELVQVTTQLIEKANRLHQNLQPIDSLPVDMPYSKKEIFNKTVPAYEQLSANFKALNYAPKSIKKSIISLPLTYMGFSGYLNPITNEAQVNGLILNYKAPTTSCHEEAHQLGFAKENEANFIAALCTMNYDDPYFRYSGTTFSLKFCLNDLYFRDEQKALCLIEETMRPGIIANYVQTNEFWESYQNPMEPFFKLFMDNFLKVNNQPDGMETYSYVVALLVNYFKDPTVLYKA